MAGRNLFAEQPQNQEQGRNLFAGQQATPPVSNQPTPQQQPTAMQTDMPWGEVGQQALQNAPDSAKQFFGNIWQAVRHPIETGGTLYDIADGAVRLMAPGGNSPNEAKAKAVGDFFSKRYGTLDGFKNALATDPVGIMGDFATVLTGGGFAAARAPGVIGRVAQIAQKAGNAIEPLNLAVKGIQGLGKVPGVVPAIKKAGDIVGTTAAAIGGNLTGMATEPTKIAASSGYRAGEAGKAWRAAVRGQIPWQGLVDDAKSAISAMHQAKGEAYKKSKALWGESTSAIDFKPISDAFNKIASRGKFEGVVIKPSTTKVVKEMAAVVDEWQKMDPSIYHTPLGLDALKQRVGDILNGIKFENREARGIVGEVYHSIKGEIVKRAPEYGKAMQQYEEASELIKNIEGSFRIGKKATLDSSVRALTSVIRNNVSTNYGAKINQAKILEQAGAPNLMEKLAGAAANSAAPRGLQGAGSAAAGMGITAGVINGTINPLSLLLIGATSPRLVGEAAHLGGRVAGGVKRTVGAIRRGANTPLAKKLIEHGAPFTGPGARLGAAQSGRLENELRRKN